MYNPSWRQKFRYTQMRDAIFFQIFMAFGVFADAREKFDFLGSRH